NEKAVDELLIDLQREKKEVEDKLAEIKGREQKLDRLIKNYEHMYKEMEVRRKKRKLESREQDLQQAAKENKEFERLIREIREEKNLEKAKEMAAKVREERKELNHKVRELREDIYYQPEPTQKKSIEVGDFVRLRTGGAAGKVESINKGKVVVLMGLMKMTANLRDVQPANEPLSIQSKKGIKTDVISDSAKFESKIDIRGLRKEEALGILETFVDKALVSSATNLRIIHGKGNGVLRDAVKRKLREYDAIDTMWHPEQEFGGDGVTLVEFK
ncbi:MAG: Smr/MutS family protein, partial [Bacteroidota bacterium]